LSLEFFCFLILFWPTTPREVEVSGDSISIAHLAAPGSGRCSCSTRLSLRLRLGSKVPTWFLLLVVGPEGARGSPTRRGGGAGRVSKREKKWTRSRSSGRKISHFVEEKARRKRRQKRRAPSNSRATTTLSLSLHLHLHRAAAMHASVLSSSAGAPAATRGGGHVKVGFNVLIQSAPSISPSRPLSRSAFSVLSPAIA
jgi:hypothetical protein